MSKQLQEGKQRREDLRRSVKDLERRFAEECARVGVLATVDAHAMERQAVRTVEQLVPRFKEIEQLLRAHLPQVVAYYTEFNQDVLPNKGQQ